MNKKINLICIFLCMALWGCKKNSVDDVLTQQKDLELTAEEKTVVELGNQFAFSMLTALSQDLTSSENLFFSPLSVGAALTMTGNGAKGETLAEIRRALNVETLSENLVNGFYKKLIEDLPFVNLETTISIANSIWYKQGFDVLDSFLKLNKENFDAEISELDFASPQAVPTINGWIDQKTKGKIPKMLEMIPENAAMYLINAIYFKGNWDHKFDKAKTKKDTFKKSATESVQVDFMEIENPFNVSISNDYVAVQLPYTDRKFDMILVSPQSGKTLENVKNNLKSELAMRALLDGFRGVNARVLLPKFKMSYENSLVSLLTSLGMNLSFTDMADFSGINGIGGMYISDVKHKAVVEVNEEGSEAAAVTVVEMVFTSVGGEKYVEVFTFDQPFLFFIREVSSGIILFAGQINDPTVQETNKK